MSKVLDNIKTRRSVRAYQDKPIPKEILENILEAGMYAPSARNTQNWQLTVVQKKDHLVKLQKALADALENPNYSRFYNAPVLVMVSAPSDYSRAIADCATVLQNMFLAAHDLGIGSVWINQLGATCDLPEVRKLLTELKVPENHAICGCAALGYAAEDVPKDRENKGVIVYS